jgi:hypothetical protein
MFGFFGHAMNGWGEPVTMAVAAVLVPMLLPQVRRFWHQRRFWFTMLILAAFQVPLVVVFRPLIQQSRSLYMLEFGVADVLLVITVLYFTCSDSDGTRK